VAERLSDVAGCLENPGEREQALDGLALWRSAMSATTGEALAAMTTTRQREADILSTARATEFTPMAETPRYGGAKASIDPTARRPGCAAPAIMSAHKASSSRRSFCPS